MNPNPISWRELLVHLPQDEATGDLSRRLAGRQDEETSSWVLNFFSGVGAWFSALFLLPFFYFLDVLNNAGAAGVCGAMLYGGSIALSRASKHIFLGQLALSALLSGNSLIFFAIGESFKWDKDGGVGLMVFSQAVMAALTCLLFQGGTGRFLTLVAVPALAVIWAFDQDEPLGLHGIIGLLALAAGVLSSWKKVRPGWDIVAWAALLSLPCVILLIELLHDQSWGQNMATPLWPSSIMVGLTLVWVVGQHAGGKAALQRPWFGVMILATAALAAFTTPGLLVAALLLFLARSRDERVLAVVGHLFFTAFLILFYYALNVSLAQKSLVVAGSGALLLLLRAGLDRFASKEVEL